MRQVVIQVTCDLCAKQTTEQEATDFPFSWGGTDYAMDLCPKCYQSVDSFSVQAVIDCARKVKPEKKSKKSETVMAHVCDCGRSFATSQGLAMHKTRTHR